MTPTRLVLAAVAALLTHPASGAECTQDNAIYTEPRNGFALGFRAPEPWETATNTTAILQLRLPEGTELWGTTWMPNGTSWDQAQLFHGCELPGMETTGSSEAELDACRVWKGVIYALSENDVGYLPAGHEPAAPVILLSDLGPTIRYSGLVLSPGDEPHDVFRLSGCRD